MVKPLTSTANLRDRSLSVIRQGMVTGEIRPGEIYSAAALAAKLGISNSPVREAMLTLVNQGTMEVVRNRGFRVIELTDKQLDEIYELRLLLEVPAVTSLTEKLDSADEEGLRRLAEAGVAAVKRDDLPGFLQADRVFHLALLRLNGNDELVEIVERLRDRSRLYGLKTLAEAGRLESSADEHLEILDAIFDKDPERVSLVMAKHLHHVRGDWAEP
jgi:DNA-binding GntR family transcriptional regulator